MALTTDLVSYWKLDEASGTRADSHGSLYLSDFNTVGAATAIINDGADFESGSSEYLKIDNATTLNFDKDWSLSFWIKAESWATATVIMSRWGPGGSEAQLAWRLYYLNSSTKISFQARSSGNESAYEFVETLSTGTWYHIVLTFDYANKNMTGYVNAVSQGTTANQTYWPQWSSTTNFTLGSYAPFSSFFDGVLDEVGIWSRALTSTEVTELYNSGAGLAYPFGVPLVDNCISYYKLDEASGNAADSAGSNTLTNTNVTYSTGKINNGAVFNSTTDTLIGSSIVNPHAFTFWYNVTANNSRVFLANASPDNTIQSDAVSTPTWLIYDGAANRSFTTTIKNTTWTFMAFIRNGTGYDLYENGSYVESVTSNQISFDKIGRAGSDIAGTIDEVGIWSYLSAADVSTLYNGGAGLQYPFAGTTVFKNFLGFAGI